MDRIEETLRNIRPASAPPGASTPPSAAAQPGTGELGRVGERLGRIYRGREVDVPLRKLLFIAAADHGVPLGEFSISPQRSTAEVVGDLLAGRTLVSRIAAHSKPPGAVRTVVADFGVKGGGVKGGGVKSGVEPPAECWAEFVVSKVTVGGRTLDGTEDVTERAAMSREAALAAIRSGMDAVRAVLSGDDVDLVGTGAVGTGGEVAACAIAAVLTGKSVGDLTGRAEKRARALGRAVQKALDRPSPDPLDAVGVLSEYGGLEIGALAGACLAAAEIRLPVVLGGLVSTAAAAVAVDLAPAAGSYLIASDRAALPAHGALLEYLDLAPLLTLGLDVGTGEAAGAALAMRIVDAAWAAAGAGRRLAP